MIPSLHSGGISVFVQFLPIKRYIFFVMSSPVSFNNYADTPTFLAFRDVIQFEIAPSVRLFTSLSIMQNILSSFIGFSIIMMRRSSKNFLHLSRILSFSNFVILFVFSIIISDFELVFLLCYFDIKFYGFGLLMFFLYIFNSFLLVLSFL